MPAARVDLAAWRAEERVVGLEDMSKYWAQSHALTEAARLSLEHAAAWLMDEGDQ